MFSLLPFSSICSFLADATRDAVTRAGDVDLLVNNAGIFIGQSFLETTTEAWDKVMAVNVRSALVVSQVHI